MEGWWLMAVEPGAIHEVLPNALRSIISDARRLLDFGGLDDPCVA